ncbi:hypothetical protein JOF56_005877 [Kibdelosporangium banguiense]|uniref:DUF6801 domain-containing protein n=1 Tax=Kibdelosporangium banguiense TaxID=1365924 RepID=A0ABS4TM37_9PSEU|nr:DUF6801 domain-containing protein [Kibdelosporangium banguiense]MBP2325492.1 hypothetical protein [Kibdelosporangium banguiense]
MKRTGLAVALAALTVAGLATAGAAAPTQPAKPFVEIVKTLRGTCELAPIGNHVVTAELSLTLPTTVPVGTAVQPTDVKLKVLFQPETVTALREKEIASIEGIAGVGLQATADAKPVLLPARGLLPKTDLPATGELAVELPAKVDTKITGSKPGKITFTLGPLELLLAQVKTLEEPTGEVTPVVCVPDPAQDTAVGSVSVLRPTAQTIEPSTPPSSSSKPLAPNKVPDIKQRADKPRIQQEEPPAEPCTGEIPPGSYSFWSYYDISGRSEIKKLKSGINLGPGYLSSLLYFWSEGEFGDIYCGGVFGDLRWPTASGSFVAFGFVPTTADVTVIPVGKAEGRVYNGVFTGTAKVHLRLSNVRVNGTKLPVGPNCQTAEPVVLNLKSVLGEWDVLAGGTMQTEMTIPAYSGCGVTDDLDPLFTGLISGPGNLTKLTFSAANICFPPEEECAPPLQGRR